MFDGRAADSATDPWPELISALSKFPSLSTLEFVGFHWSTDEHGTSVIDMPSNLLEFNYVRSHKYESGNVTCQRTWCGLPRDAYQNLVEANSLALLARTNCRTLTKLTLPGEMSRFDVLALVDWPSLTELTVQGFPPAYDFAPLICWLQPSALPSLQKLRIRLGCGIEETFVIFPPDYMLPNRNSSIEQGLDLHEPSGATPDDPIQDLDVPVDQPEPSTFLSVTSATPGNISDGGKDGSQRVAKENFLDTPSTDTKRPDLPKEPDNATESSPKDPQGEVSSVSVVTQAESHTLSDATTDTTSPHNHEPGESGNATESAPRDLKGAASSNTTESVNLATDRPEPPGESDNTKESASQGEASSNAAVSTATPDAHKPLEGPAPLTLPSLRSLYVSNPSPDDLFWECIPSALDELALLGHPHWSHHGLMYDVRLSKEAGMSSITSGELLSILKKITVRSLTTLRISFWEGLLDDDLALIDFVVSSYPSLHRLDIHRYTDLGRNPEEVYRFSASDLVSLHIHHISFSTTVLPDTTL